MKHNEPERLSKTNHYRVYNGFTRVVCTCSCSCGSIPAEREREKLNIDVESGVVILEANINVCPGYIN